MPPYIYAEAADLSKSQVFAFAESVAKQLKFEPGGDVYALVARLGGVVRVEDTLTEDPERSGSLFVNTPKDFSIVIPAHTSELRDRFTIAHELGHFFLHYMLRRHKQGEFSAPMMALRKGSDRIEWEANWFAAAFLMPAQEFSDEFKRVGGQAAVVASKFMVSPAAAKVRAAQLQIA